jgi:tRNA-dihydrouridine synthase B
VLNGHNNDILDINMGCPASKIVNNGEGSALMKDPKKAEQLLKVAVKISTKPVTVKIRKGWDDHSVNAVEIAKIAEAAGVEAIAIHGRTREQLYTGKADWQIIKAVKDAVKIPVIGNGDVFTVEDAQKMREQTNCDGIMVGRGIQGNPWLLGEIAAYLKGESPISRPTKSERLLTVLEHYDNLIAYKGNHIATLEMRKHAAWYLKGLQKAAHYKNEVNSVSDVEVLKCILVEAFS